LIFSEIKRVRIALHYRAKTLSHAAIVMLTLLLDRLQAILGKPFVPPFV
jgi:hypothetical protein